MIIGTLVYKPHDMRGEEHICRLAQNYFPDMVGIPKCVAFSYKFGVCEFIGKNHSKGEENAQRFWRNMGGTAAFMKMLGSTDLHIGNMTCADNKPYILDLETIISPEIKNEDYKSLPPELWRMKSRSPYLSSLLPNSPAGKEYSVMMNTDDEGCAPEVKGKRVSVTDFLDKFIEGYDSAYKTICAKKRDRRLYQRFSCRNAGKTDNTQHSDLS